MTTADYRKKKPLAIFLTYFKKHLGLFLLDILCAVAISAVDLAFPLFTRTALYELLPNNLYETFFTVILILVGAYLLRTFLQFVVTYFGHIFGVRVEADIRADLFRHMQRLGHDFYDKNRTGQLMSRLTTDLFELMELAHHGPEDLLTSTLTIVGALIALSTIQWKLALVVGLMIPVCLLVVMTLRKRMMRDSVARKQKKADINTEIESSLSGIRTAKAFANEDQEIRRFDSANGQLQEASRGF